MARTITPNKPIEVNPYEIARVEDVNYDKMISGWLEKGGDTKPPEDPRSIEEIQAAEDLTSAISIIDFFELEDVNVIEDDPLETMSQISAMMEEGAQEEFEQAKQQRNLNIEEDAAEKIEQVQEFIVNDDDPLLEKDYKEKSERLIQKITLKEERKERPESVFERAREESQSFQTGTSSYNRATSSASSGFRSATATTAKSEKTIVHDEEKRIQEKYELYSNGSARMKDLVYNGSVIQEEKRAVPVNKFGGKRKFRLRNIINSVKDWSRTKKAKVMWKVGAAVCIETALAMITKQQNFDGPMQLIGYIGMMLGVFYIGTSLRAEGFDMRRLSMI